MNEVYYLLHTTDKHYNEFIDNELKVSKIDKYQFSGVYFSLIGKFNYGKEFLMSNKYFYIFPIDLLLELKNYHLNIVDYNGGITENNTYYSFNLNKGLSALLADTNYMNEVIFHDNISLNYCCYFSSFAQDILPEIQFKKPINNPKLSSLLPFYAFSNEDIYNGIQIKNKSSEEWFKKLALLANINPNQSSIKIINELRQKMELLNINRHLQQLELFKSLIESMSLLQY